MPPLNRAPYPRTAAQRNLSGTLRLVVAKYERTYESKYENKYERRHS
jgi:hypothetical protein